MMHPIEKNPGQMQSREPLLRVENLSLAFDEQPVVHEVSFQLQRGERLALVGQSGSGKSVTALALLGLNPAAQTSGQVVFDGLDLLTLSPRQWQGIRGKRIAMVFQEPMTALNPLMPVGKQIAEVLTLHQALNPQAAKAASLAALTEVEIDDAHARAAAFPHQLSGDQRQRVLIAMALAAEPELLIADEPTTALDVHLRRQVLSLLTRLCRDRGLALLVISHDLPLLRHFTDRIAVMESGRIVETGPVADILSHPQHACTQRLVVAQLHRCVTDVSAANHNPAVMQANKLCVRYPKPVPGLRGWWQKQFFTAVHDVSFALYPGQTLGIIGESGSGKTTLALALLQLLPKAQITGHFDPVVTQSARQHYQIVFQDPWSSLSPRMTVEELVGEGLRVHARSLSHAQRQTRVLSALQEVGLTPEKYPGLLQRRPHEFSGGQRQRIALARALVVQPRLLILDEPTSALDADIQQQMVELLVQLQQQHGLSYLLITHDVTLVQAMAHHIMVMRHSRVIEAGPAQTVLHHPAHDYTRLLIQDSLY